MKKIFTVLLLSVVSHFAKAQCNELFISEYLEGYGNNKGIEVFNPTKTTIDLSKYWIVRYSNGSTTGSDSIQLRGKLAPGKTWVLVNGQTTDQPISGGGTSPRCDSLMQLKANQLDTIYPAPTYMNGDDAIALVKTSPTWHFVDIFAKIGDRPTNSKGTFSPVAGWTDVYPYNTGQGEYWTKDHGMIRKPAVKQGVTTNPTAFDPTAEWDTVSVDVWDSLGSHHCNCNTVVTGIEQTSVNNTIQLFPNPAISGTSLLFATTVPVREIIITDISGKLISRLEISSGMMMHIQTNGFTPGVYIVKTFDSEKMTGITKLIIQ